MEFLHGRPTYRIVWGQVGESHALALAKKMALPDVLLWRAKDLLSEQERRMSNLVEELEKQRTKLKLKEEEMKFLEKQNKREAEQLERKHRVLDEQKERIKEQELKSFRRELAEKHRELKQLLRTAKKASNVKEIEEQAKRLRKLTKSVEAEEVEPPCISDSTPIKEGDIVDIISMGCEGTIQRILSKNKFEATINGFVLVLKRNDIAAVKGQKRQERKKQSTFFEEKKEKSKKSVLRSKRNTCDLRGCRVEEAFLKLEQFFDQQRLDKRTTVFILHGHGTGALKKAIREWPYNGIIRSSGTQ